MISYAGNGTVYSFKPDSPDDDITAVAGRAAVPRPGMIPVLPVNYWRNENDFVEALRQEALSVRISGWQHFLSRGRGLRHRPTLLRNQIGRFAASVWDGARSWGQPYYVSDESAEKTYVGTVGVDGAFQI